MIYYTGDLHGSSCELEHFCKKQKLRKDDIIVLLGDVGANYFGDWRDAAMKTVLKRLKPTFLCVHGNHEMRPNTIPTYHTKKWHGGRIWIEDEYPNLLFAIDGEIYDLDGEKHLVIGGAYSVDKEYRLYHGYGWWADEQPSAEVKAGVEAQLDACKWTVDVVLSHTCPYKYIPRECVLPGIDQSQADDSTERWLDTIENRLDYQRWYCGHWHINKRIDRMQFLFHDVVIGLRKCNDGVLTIIAERL